MEFLKVTQPWQNELAYLVQKVKTKLAEFKETQATMGNLLTKQVTKESLEQVKESVVEMIAAHDKLQDVYTQWFNKKK